MKTPRKAKARKGAPLRDQVLAYLKKREDCLVLPLDVPGRALLVLRRAEYSVVETINSAGFQPHEQKREVVAPRGLVVVLAKGWRDSEQQDCGEVGLDVVWPRGVKDVAEALGG